MCTTGHAKPAGLPSSHSVTSADTVWHASGTVVKVPGAGDDAHAAAKNVSPDWAEEKTRRTGAASGAWFA